MVKRHDYYLTLYSLLLARILTTLYSLFSPICEKSIKTLVDYRVSHKVTCESPVLTPSPVVCPLHQISSYFSMPYLSSRFSCRHPLL